MISKIKKFIPSPAIGLYHRLLAVLANLYYGRPSEKMMVIGVTGTNGKSTTVMLVAKILEEAGYKVGATSTAIFKIAEKEWLNDKKMTMLGRFALQKFLKQMVAAGCQYAVVETSSQGIEQFRHLGIHYDIGVFTNLTPEHIEAHGGFENYKNAKLKLFRKIERAGHKNIKTLKHKNKSVDKVIVVNGDDKYAEEFLNFKVDQKIIYQLPVTGCRLPSVVASDLFFKANGVSFKIKDTGFNLHLFGRFNVYNSLAAIAVAQSQGIDLATCRTALEKVQSLPGRMEFVAKGHDFKVLIDYAPEPEGLKQLFATISVHKIAGNGRIIHVFGSCGGGRDRARRPILGQISAQNADFSIVTNEDPYDDDPLSIINEVAEGVIQEGKIQDETLFKVLDRREAIKKALNLAKKGDLVLLTGKGSEQAICVAGGRKVAWDEREEAIKLLNLEK